MFKSNIDFTPKLMAAEPSNTEQGHTKRTEAWSSTQLDIWKQTEHVSISDYFNLQVSTPHSKNTTVAISLFCLWIISNMQSFKCGKLPHCEKKQVTYCVEIQKMMNEDASIIAL